MWQNWEIESGSLIDQIDSQFANSIFERLKNTAEGEGLVEEIEKIKVTLREAHVVAKENAKYLGTLEEYLVVSGFLIILNSFMSAAGSWSGFFFLFFFFDS